MHVHLLSEHVLHLIYPSLPYRLSLLADSVGPGHFAEAKTKRRCVTSLFDGMGYWDLQSHGALHVSKISEEVPVPERLVGD